MRLDHLLSREQSHTVLPDGSSSRFRGEGPWRDAVRHALHLSKFMLFEEDESSRIHVVGSDREDTMSVGWMPWRCVPMKDVATLR